MLLARQNGWFCLTRGGFWIRVSLLEHEQPILAFRRKFQQHGTIRVSHGNSWSSRILMQLNLSSSLHAPSVPYEIVEYVTIWTPRIRRYEQG